MFSQGAKLTHAESCARLSLIEAKAAESGKRVLGVSEWVSLKVSAPATHLDLGGIEAKGFGCPRRRRPPQKPLGIQSRPESRDRINGSIGMTDRPAPGRLEIRALAKS